MRKAIDITSILVPTIGDWCYYPDPDARHSFMIYNHKWGIGIPHGYLSSTGLDGNAALGFTYVLGTHGDAIVVNDRTLLDSDAAEAYLRSIERLRVEIFLPWAMDHVWAGWAPVAIADLPAERQAFIRGQQVRRPGEPQSSRRSLIDDQDRPVARDKLN